MPSRTAAVKREITFGFSVRMNITEKDTLTPIKHSTFYQERTPIFLFQLRTGYSCNDLLVGTPCICMVEEMMII
jgi:hypothetical protein